MFNSKKLYSLLNGEKYNKDKKSKIAKTYNKIIMLRITNFNNFKIALRILNIMKIS